MDNVLLNKAEMIERCLRRVAEEYAGHEDELASNFTRQDAIVLNVQRACEASIDAAMHVVRRQRLGIPQQSRDAFRIMREAELLQEELAMRMQAMVGFRNVAVHNYQALSIEILRSILTCRLGDFRDFAACLINLAGKESRN